MSRKKRIRKEAQTAASPAAAAAAKPAKPSKPVDPTAARRLAVFGIAAVWLFMGLVTGVNHIPEAPASVIDPAARAVFQGAVLGVQPLDWARGLQLGLAGWIFGLTAGVSLILEPARTLAAWLLGALGLAAGLGLGQGVILGAIGWLVGFMVAVKAVPTQQQRVLRDVPVTP